MQKQVEMFNRHPSFFALHGLALAVSFALLAGCGTTAAPVSSTATVAKAPAAPTDLGATAGNAQVSLTWSASSSATSYNVKRAAATGGPYTQVASPAAASYIDTSLTNGTTYYYVVSALNSVGESANSVQVSALPAAATGAAAPAAPAGLSAAAGNAQASLTWSASSGATGYHVKRAATSGGPYTQVAAPTAASYNDAPLTNGTTYYYVVSALNSAGESANSAQVSVLPAAGTQATAPAVPAGLSAAPGNAQATLTWSASSGATSYHVKRAATSGGPYTQVAAPTATSYTDASLTNGTKYYYVVSALNPAGESANSAQVSALPAAPVTITTPVVPAALTATPGNTQANLTWSASSGATSYHVKRSTTSGGPYAQVAAPTSASYTDTSLTNGTKYYYVVSALNSAGESANSAQVSVLPAIPPLSSCNLTSPAFCDTFDEGPTGTPGREGDLDSAKWSVAHLAPADIAGSGTVANPIRVAPIPSCKASFSSTNVYPPNDTLICDPSGTRSSQLLTGVAIQNYGVNSYMVRQPFDFAGRTGKIEFDLADDSGYEMLGGFPEIDISQDPVPAPAFQEYSNFEAGPVPNNAISVKFFAGGGCGAGVSPINTMTYNGYSPVILPPSGTIGCVSISPGAMNHYEIQLSQTQIDIYGTDASTDGGQTFPSPLHHLYSAAINLPFTRGYVHIGARNHATIKYGFGPDAIFHWDNIGFDGPVITNTQSYEIPDNTTMGTYGDFGGAAIMNLGYQLQDGTVSGKPAGIYDPVNQLPPFQFKNVNTSGAVSAQLSFNAFLDVPQYTATMTWGWKYRFNGGAWRTRTLTSLEVTAINSSLAVGGAGSAGNLSMLVTVPTGDLINGTNTFEIVPLNVPMAIPPVIANIDLTLSH